MFPQDEFKKYAIKHKGISSLNLHRFQTATNSYITPNIIEERQLNIATMDVFSRLMMDRIIFLGVPIDDDVANIIMAQLLFLETADPGRDIQLYFNSPGGSIYAGLGIYDTMQYINCDVATIYRFGSFDGSGTDDCRNQGKTFGSNPFPDYDPPTDEWRTRPGCGYRDHFQRSTETEKRIVYHHLRTFRSTLQKSRKRFRPGLLDDSSRS